MYLMNTLKLYKSNIFASIICLLGLYLPNNAMSATWATVTSEKAKIFSDIQMTSVIGYVRKGKKIRVGEVPKNKARVLPVIVSNKVAYIQLKDIKTGVEIKTLKSVSERVKEKMTVKTSIQRVGVFGASYYGFLLNNDFEDTTGNDLFFLEFGASGYHTNLQTGRGVRVNLSYSQANKSDSIITYSSLAISYKFSALKLPSYDLDFYAGGILGPYAEYKQGNDFKITGNMFGAEFGGEMRFSLTKKMSLHLGGNYQIIKFVNMKLPDNTIYAEEFDPIINGVKLFSTLSYEY